MSASTESIESLITRLVQIAPARDETVIDALLEALRRDGRMLALSIARVVELVGDELVDQGIALPPLAMACATLCDPRLGEPEREAARFEIETLMPVPDRTRPVIAAPDVPLTSLTSARKRN